jgi:FHA domain
VRAMVDVAVAASGRPYPDRQLLYVDAGLHRASVTPLEQGDEVTALAEQPLETRGLAGVYDALARRIAEMFVLATRFDPFHQAATEQLLYDRLPDCLERLRGSSRAEISIPLGAETFALDVERSELLGAVAGFYKALVQLIAQAREGSQGVVVQLSDRLARLPGVLDAMQRIDDSIVVALDPGHAARSVLEGLERVGLDAGEVKLFRHLPWRAAADAEAAAPATVPAPTSLASRVPTHVVYRGVAYPVNGDGLVVGRSKIDHRRAIIIDEPMGGVSRSHCEVSLVNGELRLKDLSSYGTFVNERRAAGELVLKPADVIRIGTPGAELHVVVLETDDGA